MSGLFDVTGNNPQGELGNGVIFEESEDFNTWDLLDAVEYFDEMRDHLNDRTRYRPPLMRDQLLELHQLAMDAYPDGNKETLAKLYDRAENLESIAFDLMMQAEKIHIILEKLTRTEPENLRGY